MGEKIFLNDRIVDADKGCISPFDAGLLHGMGLFETVRAYHGKPFRLDRHIGRLMGSARALGLPLRHSAEQIAGAVGELLAANQLADARVRITVTRGPIEAEADAKRGPQSTLLVTASGQASYPPEYYQKGVAVAIALARANAGDPMAGHKTLNYWPRLLTLQAAREQHCVEALWFTADGRLAEGCISNVFVVQAGRLLTPPGAPETPILAGLTRAAVMELAPTDRIEAEERAISRDELFAAEEVFLCNSIMQIMPVAMIDRRPIGDAKAAGPGPLTRAVAQLYRKLVDRETAA